ncbi:Sister chromatid cohesion protein pds5 [Coemansia sp. Benny D115]|nr:Sister chromatid cohesion protein pds5 [Coemansia sp. Benny D115]
MTEDGGPHQLSFEPKLFTNASQKKTKLSKELNGLEQETVDTQSLDAVTKQLLAAPLLRHKESGVVSYVACCIADILRLYAPEAPYDDDEIKVIFNVFIDQLQLLSDTNSQFFPLREYLLTSLATVRTPALVAMLPDAEDIISRFFTVLIGVVNPTIAHSIQMQILDILQQLLEEPKSVPQDVVDVILLQFTKKRQQDNPAAHQLASDLANGTSDVLQKYIYQYFNDVIVSAAQQRAGHAQRQLADGEYQGHHRDRGSASSSSSLDDLRSAHYLILELNRSAPGTLLNVIPQLEEELSVEDVDIRILATGVLGEMFIEKGFTLAKRYDSTWKTWKGRRADTSPLVRIQWVESAVSLYQHQPQLSRELNEFVVEKLRDVDDKVRQAACRTLGLLEMTQAVQSSISEEVIEILGERCKDRKAAVRSEAIIALANMYSQIYDELEQGNVAVQAKWGGIPSKIFMLRYVNDPDIDSKVESILTGAILNFAKIKDDRSRCLRLLVVFSSLTLKARSGFYSYMRRQRDVIHLTDAFLDLCQQQSQGSAAADADGVTDQRLRVLAVKISACFPERTKVENSLTQLASLHEAEIYKGLRATMAPENDIKSVRKHQKSALKKLAGLAPGVLEVTAPLWKCVGLTTMNRALVPYLIECASAKNGGTRDDAQRQLSGAADVLLGYVTDVFPEMLQSSSAELFDVQELRVSSLVAVEERLALMVRFAKAIPHSVPRSADLEAQLVSFVRAGASVRQAKYSAFLVTQMEGSEALCAELTGDMVDNLDNRHIERRAPSYAALSRLVLHAPSAFVTHADRASTYLVQSVLMSESDAAMTGDMADDDNNGSGDGADSDSDEWVTRDALSDSSLMWIYAVKILANWLAGMERPSLTRERIQLVLGTLRQLARNDGEFQPHGHTKSTVRQHLLLAASSSLLKLASFAHFDKVLNVADVQSIAMVVQHPCYEVRSTLLLNKLIPALVSRRIHVRFIPALFLVAHDPETTMRNNVLHAVELRLSQIRPTPGSPTVVEDCLSRLLFILACHPDWDDAQMTDTLELFTRYVEFYISCVCTAQNVSLLFCYAGEIKAYRSVSNVASLGKPVAGDVLTNRLYVLSELTQYLLREKSMSSNWPLNVYPGKLTLPSDMYELLPEGQKAVAPHAQPYLDPEFVKKRAKAPGASRMGGPAAPKRNRPRSASNSGAKRMKGVAEALESSDAKAKTETKAKSKGKRAASSSSDEDDDDEDEDGDAVMGGAKDDAQDKEDIEVSSVAETSDEEDE